LHHAIAEHAIDRRVEPPGVELPMGAGREAHAEIGDPLSPHRLVAEVPGDGLRHTRAERRGGGAPAPPWCTTPRTGGQSWRPRGAQRAGLGVVGGVTASSGDKPC